MQSQQAAGLRKESEVVHSLLPPLHRHGPRSSKSHRKFHACLGWADLSLQPPESGEDRSKDICWWLESQTQGESDTHPPYRGPAISSVSQALAL